MSEQKERLSIESLMLESGVGFGTSGARGLADAMTDRVCYAYTLGFLQYLERMGQCQPGDEVAIAGDLRPSSGRIMAACSGAATDLGYRPVNCGFIPTPAVAAFGIAQGIPSLMVTGSHIPDDRNGIKFYTRAGEILKADEQGIREQTVELDAGFTADGAFITPVQLGPATPLAAQAYVERYLNFLPVRCLAGARVLVYEHSTVARQALVDIFTGLGAQVTRVGSSERFIPVDTEAIRPEDVALALTWAETMDVDLIVSADGDGDRPLVGDERGEWYRGDVAGILTARFLDADHVVTPVSSNSALELCGWFPAVTRTRIGSPYVIEAMQQAAAGGARRVVGYEANGGFLTQSPIERGGRTLPALPTRDAVIVAVALLLMAREQELPVSALRTLLPPRFTASDRLKAFPGDISRRYIDALRDGGAAAIEAMFPDLGPVDTVDETDGLRITFSNGEVVHLRPSGNAPELRCYVEADTPERAQALNRECLHILEGWRD